MRRADQRKYHYIYKIIRFDGAYYIGMHSTDDLNDSYFGSGQRLWKSIKKYGKNQHIKEILELLPSREALRLREKELVNESTLNDPMCMNLIIGGGGFSQNPPHHLDEEHKRKISESLKGRPKPKCFGERISKKKKGVKLSEHHKENLSTAKRGKRTSDKHRKAVSEGRRGIKFSDQHRINIGKQMKGKPNLSAHKLQKPCTVDGIKIFPSVRDLVQELGHGKNGVKSPNFRFV